MIIDETQIVMEGFGKVVGANLSSISFTDPVTLKVPIDYLDINDCENILFIGTSALTKRFPNIQYLFKKLNTDIDISDVEFISGDILLSGGQILTSMGYSMFRKIFVKIIEDAKNIPDTNYNAIINKFRKSIYVDKNSIIHIPKCTSSYNEKRKICEYVSKYIVYFSKTEYSNKLIVIYGDSVLDEWREVIRHKPLIVPDIDIGEVSMGLLRGIKVEKLISDIKLRNKNTHIADMLNVYKPKNNAFDIYSTLYHISEKPLTPNNSGKITMFASVPKSTLPGENLSINRICFSPSIALALGSLPHNDIFRGKMYFVYIPIVRKSQENTFIIPSKYHVPNVDKTKEVWCTTNTDVILTGIIQVTGITKGSDRIRRVEYKPVTDIIQIQKYCKLNNIPIPPGAFSALKESLTSLSGSIVTFTNGCYNKTSIDNVFITSIIRKQPNRVFLTGNWSGTSSSKILEQLRYFGDSLDKNILLIIFGNLFKSNVTAGVKDILQSLECKIVLVKSKDDRINNLSYIGMGIDYVTTQLRISTKDKNREYIFSDDPVILTDTNSINFYANSKLKSLEKILTKNHINVLSDTKNQIISSMYNLLSTMEL